jgi:hypothetical protein
VTVPEKSESLLAGRRAIDSLPGVSILEDFAWVDSVNIWAMRIRIELESGTDSPFQSTDWHAVVSPDYPWGFLKLYPSVDGGLVDTFPHQSLNDEGPSELPWRKGDVCLVSPLRQHGVGFRDQDPVGSDLRLLWHVERLAEWIACAASGTLMRDGDPFELPPFPGVREDEMLVYSEGRDTFADWQAIGQRVGACRLRRGKASESLFAVEDWLSMRDQKLLHVSWGTALEAIDDAPPAYWIMLDGVPVLSEWTPPTTWGELHQAVEQQGLDLERLLVPVVTSTEAKGNALLFIGFPIPNLVGESASEIAWLAAYLPKSKGKIPGGFRKNPLGYWMAYMGNVLGPKPIKWVPTANWHPSRLAARGQLAQKVRDAKTVIIGAGAVGSAVAELLARGGAAEITVVDGDSLEVGNLSRHTLGLEQIGEKKADALAARLAKISPHLTVRSLPYNFAVAHTEITEAVLAADCVIDCTGDDVALAALSAIAERANGHLWASVSLGHGADSLYAYAAAPVDFSVESYLAVGSSWLDEQQRKLAEEGVIFEGAGCWHPAFPGRNDDIHLLVSAVPRLLEDLFMDEEPPPQGFLGRIDNSDAGVAMSIRRIEHGE